MLGQGVVRGGVVVARVCRGCVDGIDHSTHARTHLLLRDVRRLLVRHDRELLVRGQLEDDPALLVHHLEAELRVDALELGHVIRVGPRADEADGVHGELVVQVGLTFLGVIEVVGERGRGCVQGRAFDGVRGGVSEWRVVCVVVEHLGVLFGGVEELVVGYLDGRQVRLLAEPRGVLDELHD